MKNPTAEAKSELRRRMIRIRKAASESDRDAASLAICDRLQRLPELGRLMSDSQIAAYLAKSEEASVDEFIRRFFSECMHIGVPNLMAATQPAFSAVGGFEELELGRMGLRTPVASTRPLPLGDLAAVVVPGLAFSRDGSRLGYGGGWYDRALSQLRPGTLAIGVCFDCQLLDAVPVAAGDVAVQAVVTEYQTIYVVS